MRILQVIPFCSPKIGGSIQVGYNISKGLVENGHDVVAAQVIVFVVDARRWIR